MTDPSPGIPLPALLVRAHARFVAEFEQRLTDAGYGDLSFSLGSNVLRHLSTERPVRSSELVSLSGVSKQAISQQVSQLVRLGYVELTADPTDQRTKAMLLTPRGADSHVVAKKCFAAQERAWRTRYGADVVSGLRATLELVLTDPA